MRFRLGLPARLHLDDPTGAVIVEIVDISASGLRLRSLTNEVHMGRRATVRFVLPDQRVCAAGGRVSRVERSGAFVLALDESNYAFRAFVVSLFAGES